MNEPNDELADLKAAMQDATPRPDAVRRAADLALARENFDRLQGSTDKTRLTTGTARTGFIAGVKQMLSTLTSKGGLTLTTALVACGLLVLTPGGRELLNLPGQGPVATEGGPAETPVVDPAPAGATADGTETDAPAMPEITTREQDTPPEASIARRDEVDGAPLSQGEPMAAPVAPQSTLRNAPVAGLTAPSDSVGALIPGESFADSIAIPVEPNTESFANAAPNPLKITTEEPVSTFSIDVDTAAWSVIRNTLERGAMPPQEAVRIEEMINYFPYDYPAPEADEAPFRPTVNVLESPWNADTQLVHIGIQGTIPAIEDRPALNLVFLIDTSGSMEDPSKLPLLRQSFLMMLDELDPQDEVAIVTYAGSAGMVLEPTPASNRAAIAAALLRLSAGGSTNGQGGLEQAYAAAETMTEEGEVSRVILATDGDFNVGLSDPGALEDYIAGKRDSGTYLSVLGFGRGNLQDATMQALAQNGNGTAAYIDTLHEARKVLVDQLTGALFPIANDVKIQVEFNPAQVAEYRLIGYETRALNREDFNNDRVDAGELGAGHSVTAIYEITPVGSPAILNDSLRYAAETPAENSSDEIGFLRLRYKAPGEDESRLIEMPFAATGTPGTEAQFAAAIAGFGQLLRGDAQYLDGWDYVDAIDLANANRGADPFGYRTEAVQLMRLAQSLDN